MNTNPEKWFIAFLALCLWACGDSTTPGNDGPDGSVPIGFSSDIASPKSPQTRGAVLTAIDKVYLFASYSGTADWASASCSFNYMYDQLLEKTASNAWTYSPLKFWPANPADKISFFAYAPAEVKTKGYLSVSAVNATNPAFTYTLPAKESEKLDLLIASALNRTNTTEKVTLSMKHALTQVTFKVKNGDLDSISNITLTAASVAMPGTGTLTFNAASASDIFTWTPDTSADKITTFIADEAIGGAETKTLSLDTATGETKTLATFFMLPVGNPSATVTLKLTYSLTKASGTASGGSTTTFSAVIPMPATPLWTSGTNLVYTVSIIDDRLLIDNAVVIKDFETGTTGLEEQGDISAT